MDFEVKRWLKRKFFCTSWWPSRRDRPKNPQTLGRSPKKPFNRSRFHSLFQEGHKLAELPGIQFILGEISRWFFKTAHESQSCWLESRWGYFRPWHWDDTLSFRYTVDGSEIWRSPVDMVNSPLFKGIPRFSKTPADLKEYREQNSWFGFDLHIKSQGWICLNLNTGYRNNTGPKWWQKGGQAGHKLVTRIYTGCFEKIGVPENGMVSNGKPYWNGWCGGTPIFGNIHMNCWFLW